MGPLVILFLLIPFVNCSCKGLDVAIGKCPTFQGAANFNLKLFAGAWLVSQRTSNCFVGPYDCEAQIFIPLGNDRVKVLKVYSESYSETARAFQAIATVSCPATLTFVRNRLGDNLILNGKTVVLATDNVNYAITAQCYESMGCRIITGAVLTKCANISPAVKQAIDRALARISGLPTPFPYTDLEKRCTM